VFDFAITEDEMHAIAILNCGQFVLTDDEKMVWLFQQNLLLINEEVLL